MNPFGSIPKLLGKWKWINFDAPSLGIFQTGWGLEQPGAEGGTGAKSQPKPFLQSHPTLQKNGNVLSRGCPCAWGIPGSEGQVRRFWEEQIPGWKGMHGGGSSMAVPIPGVLEGTGSSWSCPSAMARAIHACPIPSMDPWELPPKFSIQSQRRSQGWGQGHFAPALFLPRVFFLAEGLDNSSLRNSLTLCSVRF